MTRTLVACAVITAAAVGLFLLIAAAGGTLIAPPAAAVPVTAVAKADLLPRVLVALVAILLAGRVVGALVGFVGQPAVIGEVVAGILLGPSLLGRLAPDAMAALFPPAVVPTLGVVAQLGVIAYMFVVGLELDLAALRSSARVAVAVSNASIAVPFVLGAALALWLYPNLSHAGVSFTSFALFLGVAMSVTAFPVLARLLADRGMDRSPLGVLALGCGAVDDVTAWCLLALVSGVAQADARGAVWVGAGTALFVVALLLARPVIMAVVRRWDAGPLTDGRAAVAVVAMLAAALATEWVGIHAVFGAFLLGAVVPHDSPAARALVERMRGVTLLLLPAFFAFTGLRTEIGLVSGPTHWLMVLAIIAVATAGKFGGTWVAARLSGMDDRSAATLGALMNTRGLMELIVLNVGLDLGVIGPTLFAMMVLMALVTTMATGPALALIGPCPSEPKA